MATPLGKGAAPLDGARVLICRPEPEASRLAEAFLAQGATTRVLPTIERVPLPETPQTRQLIVDLDLYQHVIAVSPYAARQLLERIDAWWPQLPMGIRWYGVGAGTAAELEAAGLTPNYPAQGFTSEALLTLPSLQQLQHDKVLLARGEEGRELIRATLEQRGAQVTTLPLYRRQCPTPPAELIDDCLTHFQPDIVITLSGETLNNFIALSDKVDHNCRRSLLLVPVDRVARLARNAGFSRVVCAEGMTDRDIVNQVIRCYSDFHTESSSTSGSPDSQ